MTDITRDALLRVPFYGMRHPHRDMAGAKFRRQVPVGPFIADFLCKELSIIVEADGGQHSD